MEISLPNNARLMLSCLIYRGVLRVTSTQASCSHQVLMILPKVDNLRQATYLYAFCVEKSDKTSDMDRVWQKRRNQFHTGFNIGLEDSESIGYSSGLVRGITTYISTSIFVTNFLQKYGMLTYEHRHNIFHLVGDISWRFFLDVQQPTSNIISNVTITSPKGRRWWLCEDDNGHQHHKICIWNGHHLLFVFLELCRGEL
ncbi:hypothetical protein ACJIZ3_016029 [Penstemon smallii]|uniref:Uncharacterized protein n=1 Tax=Penstemon smallii TaxID=265156 RepID=A0ABD3RS12_9LAMI